jgi:putative glutamine amidotransferase
MESKKPTIGIILDWQKDGSFSAHPHYALRTHYFDAIQKAGGLPVAIPFEEHLTDHYLQHVDGVLIPGGFFASPEEWYITSEKAIHPESTRSNFEYDFIRKAVEMDKPFLGICAGMQNLCGVMGGKLHKNVHTAYNTQVNHLNEKPPTETAHIVHIDKDSRLHKIINNEILAVNSAHTEAVAEVPNIIKVTAKSPEGIIEAVEMPDKKFILGIQWHPEFFTDDDSPHFQIFKSFVEACHG